MVGTDWHAVWVELNDEDGDELVTTEVLLLMVVVVVVFATGDV